MSILTAAEAASVLRVDQDNAEMLNLLPLVDEYIFNATGHDWAKDLPAVDSAKAAARMLLVLWYENPGMVQAGGAQGLAQGLTAALTQLEVMAGWYHVFEGNIGAGSISVDGVGEGDVVEEVILLVGGTRADVSEDFGSTIGEIGVLEQLADEDLSGKFFRALVRPLGSVR